MTKNRPTKRVTVPVVLTREELEYIRSRLQQPGNSSLIAKLSRARERLGATEVRAAERNAARAQQWEILNAFLPALREARYKRKLSCAELAPLIGATESALNSWEQGRRLTPPKQLSRWRNLLNV